MCCCAPQSVVNYEIDPPEGVCHWRIDLEDDESADLLQQLPTAVTWLERSMRQAGSKVLVHCNAGMFFLGGGVLRVGLGVCLGGWGKRSRVGCCCVCVFLVELGLVVGR